MSLKVSIETIKPKALRLIVKQQEVKNVTGIALPANVVKSMQPNVGTIEALDSKIVDYKKGDTILFFEKAGFPIQIGLENYQCMHYNEVIGVIADGN